MDLELNSTISGNIQRNISFLRLYLRCIRLSDCTEKRKNTFGSITSRLISNAKQENEDDEIAVVNEVGKNFCQEIVIKTCLVNLNDQTLPHLAAPEVSGTAVTGQGDNQHERKQTRQKHQSSCLEKYELRHDFATSGGYCGGLMENDEQDNNEQDIMGATGMSSVLHIILYLILTVSSSILCLLPRVFGDIIPKLFLPCPWLFYGFNFALMLSAAASLVSLDAMSNMSRLNHSFSDLAVVSILAAGSFLLFSSLLWAI